VLALEVTPFPIVPVGIPYILASAVPSRAIVILGALVISAVFEFLLNRKQLARVSDMNRLFVGGLCGMFGDRGGR
jgi:hypothetical protein